MAKGKNNGGVAQLSPGTTATISVGGPVEACGEVRVGGELSPGTIETRPLIRGGEEDPLGWCFCTSVDYAKQMAYYRTADELETALKDKRMANRPSLRKAIQTELNKKRKQLSPGTIVDKGERIPPPPAEVQDASIREFARLADEEERRRLGIKYPHFEPAWPFAGMLDNPWQPRDIPRSEEEMEELVDSIKTHGIRQALSGRFRRRADGTVDYDTIELAAGHGRRDAGKKAGLAGGPIIVEDFTDEQMAEIGIIENEQRSEMNPISTARSYQRMINEFGWTQERVADRVGKKRASIANALRLLTLPPEIQALIGSGPGKLSEAHGKALAAYSRYPEFLKVYVTAMFAKKIEIPASKKFEGQELPFFWEINDDIKRAGVGVYVDWNDYDLNEAKQKHPKAFYSRLCLDPELHAQLKGESVEAANAAAAAEAERLKNALENPDILDFREKRDGKDFLVIHPNTCAGCTGECPCRSLALIARYGGPQVEMVCADPKRHSELRRADQEQKKAATLESVKEDVATAAHFANGLSTIITSPPGFAFGGNVIHQAAVVLAVAALRETSPDVIKAVVARLGYQEAQFPIEAIDSRPSAEVLSAWSQIEPSILLRIAVEAILTGEIEDRAQYDWGDYALSDWVLGRKPEDDDGEDGDSED